MILIGFVYVAFTEREKPSQPTTSAPLCSTRAHCCKTPTTKQTRHPTTTSSALIKHHNATIWIAPSTTKQATHQHVSDAHRRALYTFHCSACARAPRPTIAHSNQTRFIKHTCIAVLSLSRVHKHSLSRQAIKPTTSSIHSCVSQLLL